MANRSAQTILPFFLALLLLALSLLPELRGCDPGPRQRATVGGVLELGDRPAPRASR